MPKVVISRFVSSLLSSTSYYSRGILTKIGFQTIIKCTDGKTQPVVFTVLSLAWLILPWGETLLILFKGLVFEHAEGLRFAFHLYGF